jgi:hypothetical protein
VWLIYGDLDEGWKDPYVSSVFVRIDGSHLTGDDVYREYRVRAIKVKTAIERAVELIQSPYALCVTVYKVRLPLSAAEVGFLGAINARIQRDPAWGAFKTIAGGIGRHEQKDYTHEMPVRRLRAAPDRRPGGRAGRTAHLPGRRR